MRTRVRDRLVVPKRTGACVCDRSKRLCGAAEVCVYAESPLIQQPFWDVEPISISLAPGPKLRREGIGLYRESQLPDLHFEFRTENRSRQHRPPPVRIAALTRRVWLSH